MNQQQALIDIQSHDTNLVVAAAKFLSGVPESNQELLRLLPHEHRLENRHGILYALTSHVMPADWDLMIRVLSDESEHPTVRGQAAEALAYAFYQHAAGSPEFEAAARVVIEATRSPESEVRYCAAHTLGATRHKPFIPILEGLLNDHARPTGWRSSVSAEARRAIDWILL